MPIRTNMGKLAPRRQAFSKEITFLSKGYTNPQAWPEGKIVVYPWDSSVNEYMLELNRKATRNDTVFALITKVCNLNGATVDDLIASEVMMILMTSRALAVGSSGAVHYKTSCPNCRAEESSSIAVPDELEPIGAKEIGYPGYDDITLPDCKDVVRLRPLQVRDERIILDRPLEVRRQVSDRKLRNVMAVVSINETRPDTLEEMLMYYDALSPADLKFLEDKEEELSPHLNLFIPHQCDECGHRYKFPLNLDVEFFR